MRRLATALDPCVPAPRHGALQHPHHVVHAHPNAAADRHRARPADGYALGAHGPL